MLCSIVIWYINITGYDTVALSRFGFISNIIDNCFGVNIVTPPRRWSTDGKTNDYAIYNSTGDDTIDNRVKTVTKGDNLGDTLDKFLKSVGYGIDVLYANDNIYNIYIYKGTDRSDSVTFRSDLDNLKNCTYIKDISNVSNVARITSMDSTATVPTYADGTSAPDEIRGINRREIKFSSDLIGESDRYAALQSSGIRQLRDTQKSVDITADIMSNTIYKYGVDYKLGDVVKIVTDFGIQAKVQLSEVTECWDIEGYTLIPTFSDFIIMETEEIQNGS